MKEEMEQLPRNTPFLVRTFFKDILHDRECGKGIRPTDVESQVRDHGSVTGTRARPVVSREA